MRKNLICFFFVLLNVHPTIFSNEKIDYELEQILETLSYESSFSTDLNIIENLHQKPINLKTASFNDLAILPGFSSSEIQKILNLTYKDTIRDFDKLFENINLTFEQKFILTYCTTFKKYPSKKTNSINFRSRNKSYLINPDAIDNHKFIGNSLDLYNRLNINFEGFQFNFLIDKDFGEKNITDFKTGNIKFETNFFKIIVGDYLICSGMGNILWKPFSLRKGSDVISPAVQYHNDILDYKSSMDYYFKRGLAIKYSYEVKPDKDLTTMVWFSNKRVSGNIENNLVYGNNFINEYASSLYKTGYFRTQNEINKRDNLNEKILGFATIWDEPNYNFGVLFNRLEYDKFIYTKSSSDILGKNLNFYSIFSKINLFHSVVLGEFSLDDYRNTALKISLNKTTDNFEYAIGFRNFNNNFKSPFGMTYGEKSYPNNETGLYFGIRYFFSQYLVLNSYLDLYNSEELIGNDILAQIDWNFNKNGKLITRVIYERKSEENVNNMLNEQNIKIRLNFDYKLTSFLDCRIRAETNFYDGYDNEFANLLRFDLRYNFDEYYRMGFSYSIFKGESYNVAIWQYEMPVNGYMTTIPLYGEGFRSTAWFSAKLFDCIDLKIVGIFYIKNNVDNMGSGLLEINGNKDIRFISQLEFKL